MWHHTVTELTLQNVMIYT